jgi:TetR/AcrR family transcriptional regulator, transcriptional repressor of bet genes
MTDGAARSPRYRRYSSAQRRLMLIDAGLACLARGGILEFTTDNICREAGASRGLITHHFKSKDGLLAAVYAAMYDRMLALIAPADEAHPDLVAMVEAVVSADLLEREPLNAWLALWGEVSNNPQLQAAHRERYAFYRNRVAAGIRAVADERGVETDADALAVTFISLVDGLWLERCLDAEVMSDVAAREACFRLLEAFLGPLPRAGTASENTASGEA